MRARVVSTSLLVYGALHFLVDALGAAAVFAILARDQSRLDSPLLLTYGLISFASRPLLGLLVDTRNMARDAAIAGSVLVAAGVMVFTSLPYVAVITLGVGNALFHVGAGSICYRLEPGKSGPSGLFAAPGALGIFVGTMLGAHALSSPWGAAAALVGIAAASRWLTEPAREALARDIMPSDNDRSLLLVLVAIALVSFAGFALRFPWQSTPSLAVAVVLGVALGRAMGGVLGDRFGWRLVALGGLLAAIPFLVAGTTLVACGVFGATLLNLSVPVASMAVYSRLRTHPAFAFGLVSLALIAGGIPAAIGIPALIGHREFGLLVLPVALGALYAGFRVIPPLQHTVARWRTSIVEPT